MIRVSSSQGGRPVLNTLRGEFDTPIAGEVCRFDTRLSTIAAIEEACGGRAIVEVLNGVIVGRRANDLIPLIAAALAACEPWRDDPRILAAEATVGEAEAFVLALIFALGFTVGAGPREGRDEGPFGPRERWRRWREFALGCLKWPEEAFWACSWLGLVDAWNGHHRFVLGVDSDEGAVSRAEALGLDEGLRGWQQTGIWQGDRHGGERG